MRVLILAAVCFAAGSCGGSTPERAPSSTPTVRPARAPRDVVQIEIKNIRFRPERVVVQLGQTVRWTNHDSVAHTVAAQTPAFVSEAITPGQTYGYRPPRKGTIQYFCTIHANQNGVLVVR
jgi:plastocyanin